MLYEGICSADLAAPYVVGDGLLLGFLDLGVLMEGSLVCVEKGGERQQGT